MSLLLNPGYVNQAVIMVKITSSKTMTSLGIKLNSTDLVLRKRNRETGGVNCAVSLIVASIDCSSSCCSGRRYRRYHQYCFVVEGSLIFFP